jgi:phage protein U
MASAPLSPAALSPAHLMTLGLFVFGMDTAAYDAFSRKMAWRHEESPRFMARAASQFAGPGDDNITIGGRLAPELAGTYGAIETLIEMADTGDGWLLMDGLGRVLGTYKITSLDQTHHDILAGGIPRSIDFSIDLKRVD